MKPRRVVFACDRDAPTDLVRDAIRIGQSLSAQDNAVAFLVGDPVGFVEQAGSWVPSELYQAPLLSPPPHLVMKRPPIDGFADLMAALGFADKQHLITLASVWQSQLERLKPDIIVGLLSPMLWLVGPAHCRTIALGSGYSLPPALGSSFPRFSMDSTPVADEQLMLANANAVLARYGQPEIAMLSEVLTRCEPMLYGLSYFDPYIQLRNQLSAGVLGPLPSPELPPVERRVAAFLDVNCPGIETLVLALAGFGSEGSPGAAASGPAKAPSARPASIAVDVCITGATVAMRRYLEEQHNVTVWQDYFSMAENIARASIVVHHGVQDIAQHSMAVGRPQIIVPWTREQEILGYSVGYTGFATTLSSRAPIQEVSGKIRELLGNPALVIAAQHHARQISQLDLADVTPNIVREVQSDRRELAHS